MSNKRRKLDLPIKHFTDFFKDPPGADELISTLNAESTANSSDNRPVQPPNKKAFRGLQLEFGGGYPEIKDANRVKVFIATLYLKRKLFGLTRGRHKLDRDALKKNSKVFIDMANELSRQEPRLRGVTSIALFSHYTRILEYCQHVKEELESQRLQWNPTLFYGISSELLKVNEEILDGNQGQDEINEAQETSDEPGLSRSSNSRNGDGSPKQPAQRADPPLHSLISSPSSSSSNGGLPTHPSETSSPPPSRHPIEPVDDFQHPSPGPEDRLREDSPILNSETNRMHAHQDAQAGQECPLDDFVRALCDQDKITRSDIEDLQKEVKDLQKEVKDLQKDHQKEIKDLQNDHQKEIKDLQNVKKDLREKVDTLTETMKALEKIVHDLKRTVEARPAVGQPWQGIAYNSFYPNQSYLSRNSSHNINNNTPQ